MPETRIETRRCNHCAEAKPIEETALIRRLTGGNFRRASASRLTTICDGCVRTLYRQLGRRDPRTSYLRVSRWDRNGIIRRALALGEKPCQMHLTDGHKPRFTNLGQPVLCGYPAPTGDCGGEHNR